MTRPVRRFLLWASSGAVAACVFTFCATLAQSQGHAFVITGADASLRAETETILNAAHADLLAATGVGLTGTIHVVFVAAEQSFDSVLGGAFPDWGVAAAVSERNLIAFRSPADFPVGRGLSEILRHELAHLHLDALTHMRPVPRWIHEGYAQQFAHEWRFGDDWIVARAAIADQILPLRDIDGVNSFKGARVQLAYAQSYLAVGYLLDAYGWPGFVEFTEAVRDGADWDEAFRTAIGTNYAGFQREYGEHLRDKYNWAAFFGDTVLLWIAIVVAFLILYLVKRRRSTRKEKEWEAEEAIEDILYGPLRGLDHRPPDDGTVSGQP
ncbi:MAG TPA: peptidase MA family metallohydrolase [Acidobacteriota bacterium]|nr:peptidase MA family metallohydrolase [Acidobacteriota bacterium]